MVEPGSLLLRPSIFFLMSIMARYDFCIFCIAFWLCMSTWIDWECLGEDGK